MEKCFVLLGSILYMPVAINKRILLFVRTNHRYVMNVPLFGEIDTAGGTNI